MAPVNWTQLAGAPDPCLVCGCAGHDLLYKPTYQASLDEAPGYFLAHRTATAHGPIVRCRSCGFVFTSPRFSPEDYDRIYQGIPTPHEGDSAFDPAKTARFRRLARAVRRHIGPGPHLDFGCGDGTFLRVLGYPEGLGFEIGPPGRRRAGPADIITGNWADVGGSSDIPSQSMDFVTAFDVLEHLPRIREDVALLRGVLKPGGLFFVSVPNVQSMAARIMGRRWNMLLLEHLWYFSPDTLRAFLERSGFEHVETVPVPFDAPVTHIITRLAQTFGLKGALPVGRLSRAVLPVPAGIMLGVYRASGSGETR